MNRPATQSWRWLITREMASPNASATVGMYLEGIGRKTLTSCVRIITEGIASTASQKFVWIVGKSIIRITTSSPFLSRSGEFIQAVEIMCRVVELTFSVVELSPGMVELIPNYTQ